MTEIGDNAVVVHDAPRGRWLVFRGPRRVLVAGCAEEVPRILAEVESEVEGHGRHAAGFVSYEAAPAFDRALVVRPAPSFPPAWFGIYAEPEEFALPILSGEACEPPAWRPSITREDYSRALDAIKAYIRAGDTYQVNFSYRLRAPFDADPWPFFVRMIGAQGPGYGAFVSTPDWAICSASPELFIRLDGRELLSKPMKGTAPRGLGSADDCRQAEALQASEKNRAENVMIVDMVRSDMGRIADAGTVDVSTLFEIERYPTLWQLTSTVRARTGAGLADIFRALFPAASITGAPKVRTQQIIRELESSPRRIYTGSIGFVSPARHAQFNVAIRTVLVDRRAKTAEYGVGGGIVWDSGTQSEWDECLTKARVLDAAPPSFSLLETLRWSPDEGYALLEMHLRRLADSAAYFDRAVDTAGIRRQLQEVAGGLPAAPHRIRLLVPAAGPPVIEHQPLMPLPNPYRVRLAARAVRSSDPFLYHKTTQRRVYEQALAEAGGCEDVLLWNEREEITESSRANVVVEIAGRRVTPPVECGLLPGIYRAWLVESGQVREDVVRVADLARCSRVLLCNSVRGLWEATLTPP